MPEFPPVGRDMGHDPESTAPNYVLEDPDEDLDEDDEDDDAEDDGAEENGDTEDDEDEDDEEEEETWQVSAAPP